MGLCCWSVLPLEMTLDTHMGSSSGDPRTKWGLQRSPRGEAEFRRKGHMPRSRLQVEQCRVPCAVSHAGPRTCKGTIGSQQCCGVWGQHGPPHTCCTQDGMTVVCCVSVGPRRSSLRGFSGDTALHVLCRELRTAWWFLPTA